ncbi:MAG: NUDIX hydrolase [Lachnospiraceae bacterium]|nr:NUDIX hydrolase [Lachnospiraceae bacterium]
MKLVKMEKVREGKYLKNYELTYENKGGRKKIYELVSLKDHKSEKDLGNSVSGVSIAAFVGNRMLLLKEFRMAVNREIYNLCAGRLESDETIEECVKRELFEETGLVLEKVWHILPPSFSAVTISDAKTQIIFAEASGELSTEHNSDNEQISPGLYSREEMKQMLDSLEFSSRAQIIAWMFANGFLEKLLTSV